VLDDSDDFDDDDDFEAALQESNLNPKEDEFDDDLDDDDLIAIVDSNKPKKQSSYEIPEEFEQDDFDDDDFDAIDYEDMAAGQQKHQENYEKPTATVKQVAEVGDYANPFDSSSDDDCMILDEPALPKKLEKVKISQDPVPEGFEDVRFLMEGENLPNNFQVVGCIRALCSKIDQNSDGEFVVLANISDASGTIQARLSHIAFEYMFQMTIPTSSMKGWNKESKTNFKMKGKTAQKRIYDFFGKISIRKLHKSSDNCKYEVYQFIPL